MGHRTVAVTLTHRPTCFRPAILALGLALGLLPLAGGGPLASHGRAASAAGQRAGAGIPTLRAYPALPLGFEPNRGQTDPRVRYLARGRGYTLFLTDTGATLSLARPSAHTCAPLPASSAPRAHPTPVGSVACPRPSGPGHGRTNGAAEGAAVRLTFLGAGGHPAFTPRDRLPGVVSYLRGRSPRGRLSGLPSYARVAVRGLYPGVDAAYYGRDGHLEYDLLLAPGADPRAIRLRVDGGAPRLDRSGDLVVTLPGASGETLRQRAPVAYQDLRGARRTVAARYVLLDAHTVGVRLGAYDRRAPLVVDPALDYSTYLGGNADDIGYGIAVDRAGNAYIAGSTGSLNFPTAAALRGSFSGGYDAFVAKLNPSGNGLIYSTYLGGGGDDFALGIAVDAAGNAYVTGTTGSSDFPTANPLQGNPPGLAGAAFVAKLNPTGAGLAYSTYLGGGLLDVGYGIAVDAAGSAYVTGQTTSPDFPMVNPVQGSLNGSSSAFVAKLAPAGNSLVYSTYLGGSGDRDQGNAVAVDASGAAYVTGMTDSRDFPTANALQKTNLSSIETAFVSKLNPAGNGLVYSTFLGGGNDDMGGGIAVDASGAAYVTGETSSSNFPTANAVQGSLNGSSDAFVSKIAADGSALAYSTFLGGGNGDAGGGIAVDPSGDAYVAGGTYSADFPTANPAQAAFGGSQDAFVAEVNPAGNGLVYSTYLGGSRIDSAADIALDAGGNAYVTGQTASPDLPTARPLQGSYNGDPHDAFVAKLGNAPIPAAPPTAVPSSTPAAPTRTTVPSVATATRAVPVATATPAATITPTRTITPTAPITPGATPTRTVTPGSPGAPGGPCSSTSAPTLAVAVGSRGIVTTGGRLTVTVRTAPNTRVNATLQVTGQRVSYTGTGKNRKRAVRMVVLYTTSTGGASNRQGLFTGRLHVTYKPSSPARARLNVVASGRCGRAERASTVTIQQPPPPLSVGAARAVRVDRLLTVTLHTARGARVAATLQVTTRRTVTVGKGKGATRTTRTVVLYSVGTHGTADRRGIYTARLHVTYKTKRAVEARLTATATLFGVTATRGQGVAIQP